MSAGIDPSADALVGRLGALLSTSLAIDVAPDTDLLARGILDSLALIELLYAIETEFDVAVELESFDLEHVRSLERMARWISSQRPGLQA